MVLWVVLLMCLDLNVNGAESAGVERIERCGTTCSQGLNCKTRPDYFFRPPCQTPVGSLSASSVFHNISLSTVMSCEGKQKCSLHLRIKAVFQLAESIQGLSLCTVTPGMMMNCQILSFTRSSRQRMSGLQVEVMNDCTSVSPNQQVQVMVKTVPSYCGITWTGTYDAPECISEELRRHVPECITGRLSYNVNAERKELTVGVSDMLEDHNYNLRLCYKDFVCHGTGANAMIKKQEPVKNAILPYSRPLPCLCIEGWSAVTDAPRVQVCPFTDRVDELWFGVSFDPLEETLSWELVCPVSAVVTLCQNTEGSICVDLPNASQNVSRGKITFTDVDPHPQLCIKKDIFHNLLQQCSCRHINATLLSLRDSSNVPVFTVASQSWIRCPFADGRFQAWDVVVQRLSDHAEVKLVSKIKATFSLGLCMKSEGNDECQITETHTEHVGRNKAVELNLTEDLCDSCVLVRRLDVKYAATVLHCVEQCNKPSALPQLSVITSRASLDLTWVVVPVGGCLSGIIIVSLVLHVLLSVHQRRKLKRKRNEKQIDPVLDSVAPALQTHHHRGILIPDSPQCGNTEKAILISE